MIMMKMGHETENKDDGGVIDRGLMVVLLNSITFTLQLINDVSKAAEQELH
jgi:hypothetical protein